MSMIRTGGDSRGGLAEVGHVEAVGVPTHALARQGRYQQARDNLKVKQVRIREDERFIICFNPEAEENLDGKYLLRTSDPKMTAEDIALGYKQLL